MYVGGGRMHGGSTRNAAEGQVDGTTGDLPRTADEPKSVTAKIGYRKNRFHGGEFAIYGCWIMNTTCTFFSTRSQLAHRRAHSGDLRISSLRRG